MTLNEFLNRLKNEDNKLSLLLVEAKQFKKYFKDDDFINYIDNELNGYKDEYNFPEYRKIPLIVRVDLHNYMRDFKNEKFDFSLIKEKLGIDVEILYLRDSIIYLENLLQSTSKEEITNDFPNHIVKRINEQYQNGNIDDPTILNIHYNYPIFYLKNILKNVRLFVIERIQNIIEKINIEKPLKSIEILMYL